MENILYLDSHINIYVKKLDKILNIKPYKNTLSNGIIIDSKKFIKILKTVQSENKLNNSFINESIIIINNSFFTKDYKEYIKQLMEEINYKNCKFIHEIKLINLNKNTIFINYNETYFYINYINKEGKIKTKLYEKDLINKNIILNILKIIDKKNIIISGKKCQELVNILKKTNYNYYYFEDSKNTFIELLKNKMSKLM